MNVANQPVSIESLFPANHVESVNGLLYISGGGWMTQNRVIPLGGSTPVTHMGLALIVAVPWHQTNYTHNLIIDIRDEDATVIANISAQLNVGRPPGLRPGKIQYANVGLPMDITFPHAGDYEIIARVDGLEGSERRWAFDVKDIQQLSATA
jgi:hypothetical protein